jgi:hypothetical protein
MAVSITLNRARTNITEAGVSLATLAVLGELRPTTLSSIYRGVMALDSEKEARLLTISFRLLELQQALAPFDLPKEAGDVARLLAQLEDGRITLDEVRDMVVKMIGSN